MGPLRFELKSVTPEATTEDAFPPVDRDKVDEFIAFREIGGLNDKWVYHIRQIILHYLDYLDWNIDKKKTLEYLSKIRSKNSTATYRKKVYQIRKFLTFLHLDWPKDIIPPPEPHYMSRRITNDLLEDTLSYFKGHRYYKQIHAIILLGASSGLRAEELYQLNLEDIDLDNDTIYVNHNPNNGQSTKTKKSRVSFFSEVAKQAMIVYLSFYSESRLKCLFNQYHMERIFRKSPMLVKELRKYFSQEWDRRGGPTSIKKILMGHSLKGDVDLMHYNYQSEEDLKKIYDKVMNEAIE